MPQEYFFEAEGCYITELSNTPDDPSVSIAQARVSSGVTTAWHRLKNTTERYVIIAGSGLVEIDDDAPRAVQTGDVVLIAPMKKQRITNIGQQDLVFMAICTPRFVPENYEGIESC